MCVWMSFRGQDIESACGVCVCVCVDEWMKCNKSKWKCEKKCMKFLLFFRIYHHLLDCCSVITKKKFQKLFQNINVVNNFFSSSSSKNYIPSIMFMIFTQQAVFVIKYSYNRLSSFYVGKKTIHIHILFLLFFLTFVVNN